MNCNCSLSEPNMSNDSHTLERGPDSTVSKPLCLKLPPPSPIYRIAKSTPTIWSPLLDLLSPRTLSDTPPSVEDQRIICRELEKTAKRTLHRLATQYQILQSMINKEATSLESNETVEQKRKTTEELLDMLD